MFIHSHLKYSTLFHIELTVEKSMQIVDNPGYVLKFMLSL